MNHLDIKIKGKNYKSFGEESEGFDYIYPFNIIIGRNNSGKSALIDLIHYCCEQFDISSFGHKKEVPEMIFTKTLVQGDYKNIFDRNVSGGSGFPPNLNHFEYAQQNFEGKKITYRLKGSWKEFLSIDANYDRLLDAKFQEIINNIKLPFNGKSFKKLSAERDIKPEGESDQPRLDKNGNGATNIIGSYINKANLDSSIVEIELLKNINAIFNPDSHFTDIRVQKLASGAWEIYLEEKEKGRIPLSSSGSGLKTVILVLVNLILIPKIEGKPLNDYIFAFEELENNLHPALQRRLINHLRIICNNFQTMFFLTTHSSVIIDLFSKNESAQIIHLIHNGKEAQARKIDTYLEKKGILDDLDIRASDLLQSNCIVWVEGPSDRLYFNRWIELYSEGKLKEGFHYQCVFYGGRLLAHLNVEADGNDNSISILRINHNAVLMIDSDKRNEKSSINKTKTRIVEEIKAINGIAWVTEGKEVENYLSEDIFKNYFQKDMTTKFDQYSAISDFLDIIEPGEGLKFTRSKVLYAEYFLPFITIDSIESNPNLKLNLKSVSEYIYKCNSIK